MNYMGYGGPARTRTWEQGEFLVATLQPLIGLDGGSSMLKYVFRAESIKRHDAKGVNIHYPRVFARSAIDMASKSSAWIAPQG